MARSTIVVWRSSESQRSWELDGKHEVIGERGAGVVNLDQKLERASALALAGTAVILSRRGSDPWWRFVLFGVLVSPVAASFVYQSLNSRRMIALPVFLALLTIPALEAIASLPRPRARAAIAAAALTIFAVEAVHWQIVYHQNGPRRLAPFEAEAAAIIDRAFQHAHTVYAFRSDIPQYIDLLLYGALERRGRSSSVILASNQRPPAGALFIGRARECPQCPKLDENGDFVTYRYKPAPPGVVRTHFQLNSPLLPVGSRLQFLVVVDNNGAKPARQLALTVKLPGALRLGAPPYHDRGTCQIHSTGIWYQPRASSTIVCHIGYLPGRSSTTIRYQVLVAQGGPQTMTARVSSDQLNMNPDGTASALTVNLSPPAYTKNSPARG